MLQNDELKSEGESPEWIIETPGCVGGVGLHTLRGKASGGSLHHSLPEKGSVLYILDMLAGMDQCGWSRGFLETPENRS